MSAPKNPTPFNRDTDTNKRDDESTRDADAGSRDSYVVAPGQSLLIRDPKVKGKPNARKQYLPGDAIPAGYLSEQELSDHTASGLLVKNGERTLPGGQRRKSPGKWNREPQSLVGKTYNQLAVMIAEIDPNETVPTTKDEAIALLSRDYDIEVDAAANAQRAKSTGVKMHPTVQVDKGEDLFPVSDDEG